MCMKSIIQVTMGSPGYNCHNPFSARQYATFANELTTQMNLLYVNHSRHNQYLWLPWRCHWKKKSSLVSSLSWCQQRNDCFPAHLQWLDLNLRSSFHLGGHNMKTPTTISSTEYSAPYKITVSLTKLLCQYTRQYDFHTADQKISRRRDKRPTHSLSATSQIIAVEKNLLLDGW